MMNRRHFLTRLGAGATLATFGGLAGGLRKANADASDYRALVCVFLYGGMDNHDVVIPYDRASYDEWARLRGGLLTAQAQPRTLENLLPIETPGFGSRQFALPAEMAGLHRLYTSGNAAILGNVGPLLEPVTRRGFEDDTVRLPPRLFSHNDQQSTWMGGSPEGAREGWGGLFLDSLRRLNGAPEFSGVSMGGGELLITGRSVVPYAVSPDGAPEIHALEDFFELEGELRDRVLGHLQGRHGERTHLLERDLSALSQAAFAANERYNAATSGLPALTTEFPGGGLAGQLRGVAQAIQARSALTACRQIFVVGMGGFDTHSNQPRNLPALQARIDGAIVAFGRAMQELGLERQVTLFTASDFGRSLAPNDDGTDHGWGAHHFVVGGAVQGGLVYGGLPEATLSHERDAGSGRLIPDLSVEQMAAPLGRWLGLDDAALTSALPRLAAFPGELRGFL
ncbi:MAG: DUF1501 domain-containing protein [Myxococcota bacterium]